MSDLVRCRGILKRMKMRTWLVVICIAFVNTTSLQDTDKFTQKFFKRLVRWRFRLIEDDPALGNLPIRPEESVPGWMPSNRITWNSLSCKQAGIEFIRGQLIFGKPDARIPENAVWKAVNVKTGEKYAYKAFGNSHDYAAEIAFYMQAGSHPALVKPVCVQRPGDREDRAQGGLLMEWFDGIDSLDYAANRSTSYSDLVQLSKSTMEAIFHVHSLGFVHADLKTGNVLVDPRTKSVKIIDFGFAAPVNQIQPFRGNGRIIPPETAGMGLGRLGFGVDWWAFGSLVSGWHATKYPGLLSDCQHQKYSPLILEKNAKHYDFCPVPVEFPATVRQLIYYCVHPIPSMRSFAKEENRQLLRNLPYFSPSTHQ